VKKKAERKDSKWLLLTKIFADDRLHGTSPPAGFKPLSKISGQLGDRLTEKATRKKDGGGRKGKGGKEESPMMGLDFKISKTKLEKKKGHLDTIGALDKWRSDEKPAWKENERCEGRKKKGRKRPSSS